MYMLTVSVEDPQSFVVLSREAILVVIIQLELDTIAVVGCTSKEYCK
jgi:hypothetical protein